MSKNSKTIEFRQDFALNLLFLVEKKMHLLRDLVVTKLTVRKKLKISSPEKNI
jgi:hypothetical protein